MCTFAGKFLLTNLIKATVNLNLDLYNPLVVLLPTTGLCLNGIIGKMALSHNIRYCEISVFRFSLVDIDSLSVLTMELYGTVTKDMKSF